VELRDAARPRDRGSWRDVIAEQDAAATLLTDSILVTSPAVELLAGGGSRDVAATSASSRSADPRAALILAQR